MHLDDQLDELLATEGPSRSKGAIHLGEMPGGSSIDVPFTILRGHASGPTVWMMAARDGDEVHASLVAMELQRILRPDDLAGSVVIMPIGNVPGFGVLSREHPLAPTYLEQQMDDRFFEILAKRGGMFVDLHSAGVPSNTVDWTLFVEGDETAESMALAYGSPFVYEHRMGGGEGPDPGLLDGALFVRLSQAAVPSILIEAGGGLPPSPVTVQRAVSGVLNVLRRLGSLSEAVVAMPEPRTLHGFRIVTPSRGGFFEDGIGLGDEVTDGQRLARVVDAHGDVVEEITAPVAGFVLTVPVNPAAGTGTWAYEIGW
jgi:predicted deacylase